MYFSNHKKLRKASSLILALSLSCTLFTGCFGGSEEPTEPSTEPNSWLPNISDTTDPTTVPSTTEPTVYMNENTGTVTAQKVIRTHPNQDSVAIGTLYPGDRVEIMQRQTVAGYTWGYITDPEEGWIVLDYIEMDYPSEDNTTSDSTTPAQNQDGDTGNEGSTDTNTGTSDLNLKGIVTGNTLNIRSTPSSTGEIVGGYSKNEEITILETSNGWGRTEDGWVNLDYVNTTGDTNNTDTNTGNDNNTTGNGSTTVIAKGIVTASELNIRSGASTDSERVGGLTYGDRVEIYEKSGSWGRTKDGWIHMDYIYQDGTTGTNTAGGIVTGNGLNIRSGPGTGYAAVGSYNAGDRVSILEQFTYNGVTWGCTNKGWISLDYVRLDGTDTGESKLGSVTVDDLNIRSGPGTGYAAVGSLNTGDSVTILYEVTVGDTTWGNIKEGWISMDYVDLD